MSDLYEVGDTVVTLDGAYGTLVKEFRGEDGLWSVSMDMLGGNLQLYFEDEFEKA